uniref:Uncharacterized protein n=1 Tax=Parascaris equorum TaxID=6256 RepID=A0A914R4W8_PAREQ
MYFVFLFIIFSNFSVSSGFRFDHELEMILPECGDESEEPKRSTARPTKMYSGYCLRPYPASRGNYAVDYSKKANVKMRKGILLEVFNSSSCHNKNYVRLFLTNKRIV